MTGIIVGISGASGVIYGVRLLEVLRGVADIETHVVISARPVASSPGPASYNVGRDAR
jgi:3-polyprenyl-4-hydroxybenzoate decarboxylase